MSLEVILQIVVGSLISILFVVWMEYVRQPKLSFTISHPGDVTYPVNERPAKQLRALRLTITNHNLPWIMKWLQRSSAQRCSGTISFHHLDGHNVFARSMSVRWTRSPEPVPIEGRIGNERFTIADPQRLSPELAWDIFPGTSEEIDVATKFDQDEECYGWSNESYFSNPLWRNPRWRLEKERYLINVVIATSGR